MPGRAASQQCGHRAEYVHESLAEAPLRTCAALSGTAPVAGKHTLVHCCRRDLTPQQAASLQCAAVDHVSDKDVQEAAYFAKYAFAAYGYMLYIWSKPQLK